MGKSNQIFSTLHYVRYNEIAATATTTGYSTS